MGRSEYAKASIGIKILLSDLIQQINKDNWDLIKEMLKMKTIILTMFIKKSRISGNWKKSKKFLNIYNIKFVK